jgi:putative transposase
MFLSLIINYGTSGTIWESRFKASLIDNEQYLFTCMRYIELNPVRANMTRVPVAYPWSSYCANAQGEMDQRITPHPLYTRLGKTRHERLNAYQGLFKKQMNLDELTIIRNAWQTGTPLGNDTFKQKIESKLNCKVGQDRRGRPKRASTP